MQHRATHIGHTLAYQASSSVFAAASAPNADLQIMLSPVEVPSEVWGSINLNRVVLSWLATCCQHLSILSQPGLTVIVSLPLSRRQETCSHTSQFAC